MVFITEFQVYIIPIPILSAMSTNFYNITSFHLHTHPAYTMADTFPLLHFPSVPLPNIFSPIPPQWQVSYWSLVFQFFVSIVISLYLSYEREINLSLFLSLSTDFTHDSLQIHPHNNNLKTLPFPKAK